MFKFISKVLVITVALVLMSCATIAPVKADPFPEDAKVVDNLYQVEAGWNYIFTNNKAQYIIVFCNQWNEPVATVAPITFYADESEIKSGHLGDWVWSVRYITDPSLYNDGVEVGLEPTAEKAVEAAEKFMRDMLTL